MFQANKPNLKLGGMYPGSGVAPGGQQGRPALAHNGMAGVKPGGIAAGASRPRPQQQLFFPSLNKLKPNDVQKLMDALVATAPQVNTRK